MQCKKNTGNCCGSEMHENGILNDELLRIKIFKKVTLLISVVELALVVGKGCDPLCSLFSAVKFPGHEFLLCRPTIPGEIIFALLLFVTPLQRRGKAEEGNIHTVGQLIYVVYLYATYIELFVLEGPLNIVATL